MTWSILARDSDSSIGLAIASRLFAVGALCLHSRQGVGVGSTQALMNPNFGPAAIAGPAEPVAPGRADRPRRDQGTDRPLPCQLQALDD